MYICSPLRSLLLPQRVGDQILRLNFYPLGRFSLFTIIKKYCSLLLSSFSLHSYTHPEIKFGPFPLSSAGHREFTHKGALVQQLWMTWGLGHLLMQLAYALCCHLDLIPNALLLTYYGLLLSLLLFDAVCLRELNSLWAVPDTWSLGAPLSSIMPGDDSLMK